MFLIQKRRGLLMLAAAVLATAAAGLWQVRTGGAAMRFDKPITIVVTFPPGGGTDLLARKLGAELQQRIGQTVVVENRPGASGNIGAREVAQARSDGSTLLMVNSSFAINPAVYAHLDFDPRKDFKAVFNAGTIASVLVVPHDSPVESLKMVLAQTAGDPPLPFASCGNGTPQHMAGEMLAQAAHIRLQHVPYKGCGPAITAVAAGQVPLGVVTASSAAPLLEAGRVRAIAITAPRRVAQLPDVPTVAEQGLPQFSVEQWHGLLAPAATADAVVAHLNEVLNQMLMEPAMQQVLTQQGYTLTPQTPQQFAQQIHSDMDRYTGVARSLGLKVD